MKRSPDDEGVGVLGELPGDFMMWVLIFSEMLVFGAALLAFLGVRASAPEQFAADQALLDRTAGALNTLVLVTSGMLAARAVALRRAESRAAAQQSLWLASALGVVFLAVKGVEYAAKLDSGIGLDTSPFFMFYFLITGFHALHVLAGIGILLLVSWADDLRNIETGAAFWHMVDLVWVILFPIIYLLR